VAVKKGYTNIYWFKGGIREWRSFNYPMEINNKYQGIKIKKISPRQVARYLQDDSNILILDVRPKNFTKDARFIKNAVHSPLLKISESIKTLPRDRRIIVSDWAMRQ
jgi:rhodanese-related sulfurtransferase